MMWCASVLVMACERARGVARGARSWMVSGGAGPRTGIGSRSRGVGQGERPSVRGWMEEGRARRARVAFRGQDAAARQGRAGARGHGARQAIDRRRPDLSRCAGRRSLPIEASRSNSCRYGAEPGGTNQRACRSVFVLSRSRAPDAAGRPRPVLSGVSNGNRTRDNWSHNPVLYQLSYTHRSSRPVGLRRPGRILSSAQSAITETHRASLFEPPPLDPASFRAPTPASALALSPEGAGLLQAEDPAGQRPAGGPRARSRLGPGSSARAGRLAQSVVHRRSAVRRARSRSARWRVEIGARCAGCAGGTDAPAGSSAASRPDAASSAAASELSSAVRS